MFGISLSKKPALRPASVRLEASSFCQLRCVSCPTTSGDIHPAVGSGFLRFEDFRDFLERNSFVRRIELSNYGEIFLNPHLLKILEFAHGKGVGISAANGVNLNNVGDEVLEALVKYEVRSLVCSIDGASQETYRVYRVRGNFDTVIANIRKINHYKQLHESKFPHLIWQFIVFGHNEHELPAARELAGVLGMRFKTKISWDPKFSPIRDKEFVRAQTGEQAVTREEYERVHGRKYAQDICEQLWDEPQINWDGKVLGCCRNFWGDFGGNAFKDGLESSVNSEKMNYARDMLRGRAAAREDIPCTNCEMYLAMRDRSDFIERNDETN